MSDLRCYECFYSQFGHCPTGGSRNAVCLSVRKSYFDMPRKELEEATETEYKKALQTAAKFYHIRMDYIKNIFENKEEENSEDEEMEPIH